MKRFAVMLFSVSVATAAMGSPSPVEADNGFYGRLDLNGYANPELINARPTLADPSAMGASAAPVYLHVRPGHELHWGTRCHEYQACTVPVLFVTERWFMSVFLPSVGRDDGREQRHHELLTRERASERDVHDVHGED
jgi:hypothetical protein